MAKVEELLHELKEEVESNMSTWDIKGLIDATKDIYPINSDTKLLSSIFEIYIAPIIKNFAIKKGLEVKEPEVQNKYPDFSLRGESFGIQDWVALDVKSSYKKKNGKISGLTLGTYRGYLRDQESTTHSVLPYKDYHSHWCLCVIYDRNKISNTKQRNKYPINEIDQISTVIKNIEIIIQEKYKIASEIGGSGNTRAIGSIKDIDKIRKGLGPFTERGMEVFEIYWIFYESKKDALVAKRNKPIYSNLQEFDEWIESLVRIELELECSTEQTIEENS